MRMHRDIHTRIKSYEKTGLKTLTLGHGEHKGKRREHREKRKVSL